MGGKIASPFFHFVGMDKKPPLAGGRFINFWQSASTQESTSKGFWKNRTEGELLTPFYEKSTWEAFQACLVLFTTICSFLIARWMFCHFFPEQRRLIPPWMRSIEEKFNLCYSVFIHGRLFTPVRSPSRGKIVWADRNVFPFIFAILRYGIILP